MEKNMSVNEKIYKKMGGSGATSITVGVITIIFGIAAGVLAIVNGSRMLVNRKSLLF